MCAGDVKKRGVTTLLVNLQRIDGPVRFCKGFRMVLDVILTATGQSRAGAISSPDASGPVTAERSVEDDVIVHEVLIDVAIVASDEASCCRTPSRRIGV